jgi:formylglycine-generating enzyme required for sulfatase activity
MKQQPFEPAMVGVAAGPFSMGISDSQIDYLADRIEQARRWQEKGYFSREQPHHVITLPNYCISKYPVTVGEYRIFVDAGGYSCQRFWTESGWTWRTASEVTRPQFWDDERWTGNDLLPVVGTSWYEACAYCRWLSEITSCHYRLPTEAEWEKAARDTDSRLFPWGDAFDSSHCNTRASGLERTVPVGQYSPGGDSPYGCGDMAGNVSEWTMSKFRPYPYNVSNDLNDPTGHDLRVIRGGSWFSPVLRARTVSRGMNDPFFADNDLGFRCAC